MATFINKNPVTEVEDNAEKEQGIISYKGAKPTLPYTHKEGRIRRLRKRIRDPFNKQKIRQLKRKVVEFENQKKANAKLQQRWHEMLIANPRTQTIVGSVGCLQIDCANNITGDHTQILQSMDELTDAAHKVIEGVTKENRELLKEVLELKSKLSQCLIKIDETKDILSHYSSKFDEHTVETSRSLDTMRVLLESVQSDKPDKEVFIDGINEIRLSMITKEEYNFLPVHAKHTVSRLLHLFGPSGLWDLCNALNVSISDEVIEASTSEVKLRNFDEQPSSLILTRNACSVIIFEWLNKASSNDGIVLHEAVKSFENRRRERIHQDLRLTTHTVSEVQEITAERRAGNGNETTRTNSTGSSDSNEQNLWRKKHLSIDSYFSFSPLERQRLQLQESSEEDLM